VSLILGPLYASKEHLKGLPVSVFHHTVPTVTTDHTAATMAFDHIVATTIVDHTLARIMSNTIDNSKLCRSVTMEFGSLFFLMASDTIAVFDTRGKRTHYQSFIEVLSTT
jgi:hypothetical protein